MKRLLILCAMLLFVMQIVTPTYAHADGNPYNAQWGDTAYNYAFLGCGAYYDFVQTANMTTPAIHQWYPQWLDIAKAEEYNAAVTLGSSNSTLNNLYNNAWNLDNLYDGLVPWDYNSAVNSLNYMNSTCGVVYPQEGNSSDWTQEYNQYGQSAGRVNPCNIVTYSSSGIDPNLVDQVMTRAGVIAGLPVQRVSSGGTLAISGYYGPGSGVIGNTNWYNNGTWLTSSTITIDLNWPWAWITLAHEIGHGLGLGHVAATNEIMHPEGQQIVNNTYDAGDMNGLQQHGIYAGSGGC